MFWLTQSEFDSVERKHYNIILHCSLRKSREFVLFSVTTKIVQSPKDSWLACPVISVSRAFFRAFSLSVT